MTSFSDLPEDIVVEIMSLLPPESLLRLKYVQKSWYNFINGLLKNKSFVAKHLYNSSNKTSSLVFKCLNKNQRKQQGILTIFNNQDNIMTKYLSHVTKGFEPIHDHPLFQSKFYYLARSHCNGIVCLVLDHSILLCNPTTIKYKFLPNHCFDVNLHWTIRVGFGYDSIDDVYKVVRVFGNLLSCPRAHDFTLGSDCWREISTKVECHVGDDGDYYNFTSNKQVYCKGVYYWLVRNLLPYDEKIQSFDVHDEEFHLISLPNCFQREVCHTNLTQWNGSVALFYYPRNNFCTKPIEVWVYNNGMDSSSTHCWTKKLSILCPLEGAYNIPIAFWKSDELLIRKDKEGLISYNLYREC